MNIILQKLTFRNFKGFKEFTFSPKEEIAKVFGDNGRGKTTLYDGFSWCLFGKDSLGKTDFGMKPLDQFNEEIPKLENEVEAILKVGDKIIELKRVQSEKWVKPRGAKEAVFNGNTTDYFFNGVPVAKKEYEKRIETEIISEDIFRLITNLNEFNNMHWKKRRDVLFSIVGEISDQEVEMSNEDLNGFVKMLNGSSLEDFKKTIGAKIKKIKDEKKKIPVRIDEIDRSVIQAPEMSEEEINAEISMHQEVITATEDSIKDVNNRNAAVDGNIKQINKLKSDLMQFESNINFKYKTERDQIQRRLSTLQSNITESNKKIDRLNEQSKQHQSYIDTLANKTKDLRTKYGEVETRQFVEPDKNKMICNCCGQTLPSDNIEKTINDMKVKHQNNIDNELKEIKRQGINNNTQSETYVEEIKLNEVKIKEISGRVVEMKKEENHIKNLLEKPVVVITDFSEYAEHAAIESEINNIQKKISETEDTSALNGLIKENQQKIFDLKNLKEIYSTIEKSKSRKNELLSEEEVLSTELMKLEQQEFMCEEFMRSKVDMVEEKINSLFNFVRFKMFEKQVNGAVVETCKALVNTNGSLVPYEIANTAGKINAGIDIVNTLSRFYSITAPIFIDHNESITKLIHSESQLIGLYVSEEHKELTIK